MDYRPHRIILFFILCTVCRSITLPGLEHVVTTSGQSESLPKFDIEKFIKDGGDFNKMNKSQNINEHMELTYSQASANQTASLVYLLQHMNGLQFLQLLSSSLVNFNSGPNSLLTETNLETPATPTKPQSQKTGPHGNLGSLPHSTENTIKQQLTNVNGQSGGLKNTQVTKTPNVLINTQKGNVQSHGKVNPGKMQTGMLSSQANNQNLYSQTQMYTNPFNMLTAGMGQSNKEQMQNLQSALTGSRNDKAPANGFDPNQLMGSWTSTNVFNPEKYTAKQNYISIGQWDGYAGTPTGYGSMLKQIGSSIGNQGSMSVSETVLNGQQHNEGGRQQQQLQNQTHAQSSVIKPPSVLGSPMFSKMNFAPNNMMLPMSRPIANTKVKFSFNPDKLNAYGGTFHPGRFTPTGSHSVNKAYSTEPRMNFNADSLNQKLMTMGTNTFNEKESLDRSSQQHEQQPQQRVMQVPELFSASQFYPDKLNNVKMNFRPDQFLGLTPSHNTDDNIQTGETGVTRQKSFQPGKLFPNAVNDYSTRKKHDEIKPIQSNSFFTNIFRGRSNQDLTYAERRLLPSVRRIVLHGDPNLVEDGNVTSQKNMTFENLTVTNPTTNKETTSHITTTTQPTTRVTSRVEPPSHGFNPNLLNKPVNFNPLLSPGMSGALTQNYNFNPVQTQTNTMNNTKPGSDYWNHNGGFDPSTVNTAHMSFDINSQMGLMGKSNNFNAQNFKGGYDPMKTNILAIQNPFASNTSHGSLSFNAGSVSNFESAFVGTFDANKVNKIPMKNPFENNKTLSTSGNPLSNYFGMRNTDMSGYGGSFDPATVNNAVFNPNEVNKVIMHFDPSEMLEKNPGYSKDTASSYQFNPNSVNKMQMNFQPTFLLNNRNKERGNDTSKQQNGPQFVPGLLSGSSENSKEAIFYPASVNNAHMNFMPNGAMNTLNSGSSNSGNGSTISGPPPNMVGFNPNSVNNAKMNFSPNFSTKGDNSSAALVTSQQNAVMYNPAAVNNAQMNFQPNTMMSVNNGAETREQGDGSGESFSPGTFTSSSMNFLPSFGIEGGDQSTQEFGKKDN